MDLTILLIPFFILFISINLLFVSASGCSISNCGDSSSTPDIRFPFRVEGSGQQPESCGHPGFGVSCDGSKNTLIELSSSGNFTIKSIDYAAQEIWVNDPNNCLPKRLLTLNLSGSSFSGIYLQDFSFFNCSTLVTKNDNTAPLEGLIIGPIPCLSGKNYHVFAIPTNDNNITTNTSNPYVKLSSATNCSLMAPKVRVPVQWPISMKNSSTQLEDDLRLTWFTPECRPCESKGQMCGLETNSSGHQAIICSNIPSQGKWPLSTFIAVIFVICTPSIICLVGSLWVLIRACTRPRTRPNLPLQNHSIITPRPGHIFQLDIEGAQLEFARQVVELGLREEAGPEPQPAPTVVLSSYEEMGPNGENVCPICISEYRPKDKIGTLPACGHYFHASCINQWFMSRGRIGKTCPICRGHAVDS